MYHKLNFVFVDSDDYEHFCQIYQIDDFQKKLKRRLMHDEKLDVNVLHAFQRLIKNHNSYAKAFKSCDQRLKKNDFEAQMILKQHDSKRMIKNTHNKFTFIEVAEIFNMFDIFNLNKFVERDLLIQITNDDFIRVSY